MTPAAAPSGQPSANPPVPAAVPPAGPSDGPSAGAPVPTVTELAAQERRLVLDRFTHADAWALGTLLMEMARLRNAPVAIDIRRGGQQLFHAALPGSSPDNDAWIDRKRRVVERFGESSLLVGARHRARGADFGTASRLDPAGYAAHGGAFPLAVTGAGVIGTVTVSGLPQTEDHALVVEALERFQATTRTPSGV
ncbi:heme-degrading domain-containing protein [Streptomyces sp. NPDC058953]|uniref:heme-degrading domain-containing protein n=1 Tax=unclassified Streptomyces TaxID=2593676 RepID=UPI0036B4648D